MEITFDEATEYLKGGEEVNLNCEGYSYEISPAENWVGGDGFEGYISLVLGNVTYDNAEYILKKSISFLSRDGNKVTITI